MTPNVVGCDAMVGGQVFGPLASRGDLEAAGARPIDQVAGQRRLVAIGERINHPLVARLLRQQRPGKHVGFDIDHHDMPAGGDRRAGMGNAGRRRTGRLDNDLGLRIGT